MPNTLVPQTHAQYRSGRSEPKNQSVADAGVQRSPGPGRDTDPFRMHLGNFIQSNLVVSFNDEIRSQFAKILDEVVGKGIVIVDHQHHMDWALSIARNKAIALLTHSWCSDSGTESATTPQPYNGVNSGGSNFGPLNPSLIDKVNANAKALHDADPENKAQIPVELVTASTSGLDPEISPAAALYQATRIARVRNLPIAKVRALIEAHQRNPILGVFGEPVVNVLALNLDLDKQR